MPRDRVRSPTCTELLQAQDAKAVAACKAELDEAENAPASERMARIVADDDYGVALLAVAHSQNSRSGLSIGALPCCRQARLSPTACSGQSFSGIAPPPISNWIRLGAQRPAI